MEFLGELDGSIIFPNPKIETILKAVCHKDTVHIVVLGKRDFPFIFKFQGIPNGFTAAQAKRQNHNIYDQNDPAHIIHPFCIR